MAHPTPAEALAQLQQPQTLKLLSIAETLSPSPLPQSAQKRSSAVSDDSDQNPDTHPAALEADLVHYKELFSKLRFSYVEQSTKEKFLRSITDNPPQLVEPSLLPQREAEILALKSTLQERKAEIAELLKQLEDQGRSLAIRYTGISERKVQLEELPAQIEGLESAIARLKEEQSPPNANPDLALPLPETLQLLQGREAELASLNRQLAQLQAAVPQKTRELEKLERELKPLETQKSGTVAAAKEARRRREEGGGLGDELEERGRWLRASEKGLREMLGVDA